MPSRKQSNPTFCKRIVEQIIARQDGEKVPVYVGIDEFRGFLPLATTCLKISGIDVRECNGQSTQILSRAMSTSDFPAILSSVANKSLAQGFDQASSTIDRWTNEEALPNFLISEIDSLGLPGQLPEVGELQEYQYIDATENSEQAQLRTFGAMFGLSRQLIINDRLQSLKSIPEAAGQLASRTRSRVAYQTLLSNPVLSDGTEVFSTSRGNMITDALDADGLATAIKNLRLQTDLSGNVLNIEPKYLLIPPSLEMSAWSLCHSSALPGSSNSGINNIFRELHGLQPIVVPELEDSSLGGSSSNWFLSADPKSCQMPFRALSLEGSQKPYLESRPGWSADRLEFKVRNDFGICAIGWRGMVKSSGDNS